MVMSTHSTLVEMTAALLQPCVCRLFLPQASDRKDKIPKSSQLHSNTWPSSGVVVPVYIKRVIDHHSLGTLGEMSTHSTLVEMMAALLQPCVWRLFQPQIRSKFQNQASFTATHGHQVVL